MCPAAVHGAERVEAACVTALGVGMLDVHRLKRMLELATPTGAALLVFSVAVMLPSYTLLLAVMPVTVSAFFEMENVRATGVAAL